MNENPSLNETKYGIQNGASHLIEISFKVVVLFCSTGVFGTVSRYCEEPIQAMLYFTELLVAVTVLPSAEPVMALSISISYRLSTRSRLTLCQTIVIQHSEESVKCISLRCHTVE